MANVPPATVTITSSTGPGQAVTSLKFTDVTEIKVDVSRNWIRLTRSGSGGQQYYDYSAIGTVTWTISGGLSTVAFS